MNGGVSPGPFSGGGGGPYAVDGVAAVRYVSGSPDEGADAGGFGGDFGDDGSAAGGGGSNNANGAAAEVDAAASASSQSPFSAGGVTMIAIGAIAMFGVLLMVAVVAVRGKEGGRGGDGGGGRVGGVKRRVGGGAPSPSNSKATTYAEFVDGDGDDLDMRFNDEKGDDGAMHDDDDDGESIFSGLSRGMTTAGDRTVMTNRDVNFVHDRDYDDDFTAAMTVELGYEVKFRPSSGGGRDVAPGPSLPPPTSHYEPRVQVRSPSYTNPSRIKKSQERNCQSEFVGDTVEF